MGNTDLQILPSSKPPVPCLRLSNDAALLKLVDGFQPGIDQRLPTPAERERLAALVPDYERVLVPAPREAIEETVAMMSLAYPALRITTDEADARLELYVQELSDLPADILDTACRTALRELTFYPSIAEIRKRAAGLAQRQYRLARIRHLIAKHDAEYREPEADEPLTAEQEAEKRAIMRKLGLLPASSEITREQAA